MNFDAAWGKAIAEKRYLRRDAWSMGRASIIFDVDSNSWMDAYGRPFVWSNLDQDARLNADDWLVVGAHRDLP